MICEFCNNNEANIHLIKIINNNMEKVNLCIDCMKNLSFLTDEEFFNDLTKIISKVFEIDIKIIDKGETNKLFNKIDTTENKKCSFCGIDLSTIKAMGRVGCSNCYKEFKENLSPIIKTIHSSIEHKGKVPLISGDDVKLEKEIRDLKFRLKEEVTVENFEEAAKLRDTIKKLQQKLCIDRKAN
jgi:protein arginine kinase activator